jgi:hypothetical protein
MDGTSFEPGDTAITEAQQAFISKGTASHHTYPWLGEYCDTMFIREDIRLEGDETGIEHDDVGQ